VGRIQILSPYRYSLLQYKVLREFLIEQVGFAIMTYDLCLNLCQHTNCPDRFFWFLQLVWVGDTHIPAKRHIWWDEEYGKLGLGDFRWTKVHNNMFKNDTWTYWYKKGHKRCIAVVIWNLKKHILDAVRATHPANLVYWCGSSQFFFPWFLPF
jgi:hypothetical protein